MLGKVNISAIPKDNGLLHLLPCVFGMSFEQCLERERGGGGVST